MLFLAQLRAGRTQPPAMLKKQLRYKKRRSAPPGPRTVFSVVKMVEGKSQQALTLARPDMVISEYSVSILV